MGLFPRSFKNWSSSNHASDKRAKAKEGKTARLRKRRDTSTPLKESSSEIGERAFLSFWERNSYRRARCAELIGNTTSAIQHHTIPDKDRSWDATCQIYCRCSEPIQHT